MQKQEEQYKDQIEILTEALKTAQEGQNSMTRLLEDKREGQGDQAWEQSFRALEARISNQEAQAKEYKEKYGMCAKKTPMKCASPICIVLRFSFRCISSSYMYTCTKYK